MPVKVLGHNIYERVPPGAGSKGYVAAPPLVDRVRAWYLDAQLHHERPGQEQPDSWAILARARDGEREVLTLGHGQTDACVEVRFRRDGVEFVDVDVQPLPPDRAHELLLDHDEKARARGVTIYNARHPKP
jgi:hypothetical protein